PLAVVAIDPNGSAEWQPGAKQLSAAGRELQYLVRAYGRDGKFDDTRPLSLWMVHDGGSTAAQEAAEPGSQGAAVKHAELKEPELLAPYGESTLSEQSIRVSGGTVTVRGGGIPPRHTVWVAGYEVPVDARGNFVAQDVLPSGAHPVEVAVLDEEGNVTLYLRDLEFKPNDRFYVGMADLTVSKSHTGTAERLMQGANAPYDYNASVAGSLSFFVTRKFGDDWRVTASADTREEPVKNLVSNFLNKA